MTDIDPFQIAIEQLSAYGLDITEFIADGKLRRIKTYDDKVSKKSGWYVAHEFNLGSGRMVISGRFGNWKYSTEAQEFQFDAKFTESEKAAFIEQQIKQRQAAEKEKKQRNKQAAERADKAWAGLPVEGKSEYLARKKIHGFGCRYSRGSIAIPLYKNNKITGIQWIDKDGNKKFITGTEKQGAYFLIAGDNTKAFIVCEGFATACSIRTATGSPVAVCFDAGNMMPVVDELIESGQSVIIAADNDHLKTGNKGLQVAAAIVRKYPSITTGWPEFNQGDTGTDFNDLHVSQGLDAVKAVFDRVEPQAFPSEFLPEQHNPDEFTPPDPSASDEEIPDENWEWNLQRNDKGKPLPLSSNVTLILENHDTWKDCLWYCDFSYKIIKKSAPLPDMVTGEWDDGDSARLAVWLSNTFKFEPARNKLNDGLVVAAQRSRFHPVKDYFAGLEWDGTERIDSWLTDIFESEASPGYLNAVGSKLLIGAVARVMRPGCKMDNVMILEGRQGLRKSTSIATLFGEWFSDAPIPIGEKDAYQNIQGVWCSELAELDSFNKAESTSAKLFFSQVRDRYRPSYGQHAQDFPRQTIFIGTTNQGEYLKDYTGNRRYWPVKCGAVNLDLLKDNRDQYWAEALHRYSQGDNWWPDDDTREAFENEQEQRMQLDPWHYRIEDWLIKQTKGWCTADEVLCFAIDKDMAAITRADQNRISPIMKKMGYKNIRKRLVINNQKVNRHVYVKDTEAEAA